MAAFIPDGIPVTGDINISIEGMEAIRLSDFEGLDQETASKLMEVSRQTYGRILSEARKIIAEAIITGKILRVEGGNYEFRCPHKRRQRRKCCQRIQESNGQENENQENNDSEDTCVRLDNPDSNHIKPD